MKGILLSGGKGTRLYPLTHITSKQLLPVYNKPMIYYPLTTMLLAGVREILIISSPEDLPQYERLFGDGARWGITLAYAAQAEPRGIAEALIIGESFVGDDAVMLMLGDNLIHGRYDFLRRAVQEHDGGASIFAYRVADPTAYGVVEFDASHRVVSLEEKPAHPRSSWAIPGLYLYGEGAARRARGLAPSGRGELEITDLNRVYLEEGALRAYPMGRGTAWFDTGTPENLLAASGFVHAVESRQGLVVGCPEEACLRQGFLTLDGFDALWQVMPACDYRDYLRGISRDFGREPGPV